MVRKPRPDKRQYNGGQRTSPPGTLHPNRTDMTQAPKAATGQGYGQAGAQLAAQAQMPLPAAPPAPTPTGPGAGGYALASHTPTLTDPTTRPDEPVEAGMPFGPGPGPDAAPAPMSDVEARLRALYSVAPTPQLRELIRQIDLGG